MHRIDAQVTRTHPADDGVEVRAITIEVSARRVDQVGNLLDVRFEQAARVRIGQHDTGHIVGPLQLFAQHVHINTPARIRLDLVNLKPALHRRRRVRAVGRGGHQNALACLTFAARNQRRTDRQHAAIFSFRRGLCFIVQLPSGKKPRSMA